MRIIFYRLLALLLPLAALEILCRGHVIPPLTLPAPSLIALGLWKILMQIGRASCRERV